MKKCDAIFCGDIHIREKVPICRTDDFISAMWKKLQFIDDLGKKHNCPIYCAGDFFDKWKPSPELITKTADIINNWYSIFGDHDLPQHSLDLKHKSGLTTLSRTKKLTIIDGGHGNNKTSSKLPKNQKPSVIIKGKRILLWHILTWKNELPYPGCETSPAKKLLKKNKNYDVLVCGDNHTPFIERYKGRILINVGSMMRSNADQIKYHSAVWLYYAKTNEVKPVYLPIEEDVISREHIEVVKERDERIDSFVSRLKTDFKLTMNFKQNVIRFFGKNKTKKKVKEIILKHMEE